MMTVAAGAILLGALWIMLAFLAAALFLVLAPVTGMVGAALLTALAALIIILFIVLIIQRKVAQARQNSLIGGLMTSGVLSAAAGFVGQRPLLSLGIGGALAALFISAGRSRK